MFCLTSHFAIKTIIFALCIFCQISTSLSKAQFFDAFTSGKEFFTGGEAEDKSSQQNSGYGAPQASYGAPAPSYGAPTQRPSYHAKPSYHGGGKGVNFKQIEIPVPDIDLPSPLEFKAGVLRSKGRIASGLLHAKAGILRAGANILAQKANTLDKIAQAIPAVKAGLIQKLKGSDKGYGGGHHSSGYNAPSSGYDAPQAPPSYNAPSSGYGVPQGPVLGGGGGGSLASTFNNNNFGGGGGSSYNGGGSNNNFGSGGGGTGYGGGNNFGSSGSSLLDTSFSSAGTGYNSGNSFGVTSAPNNYNSGSSNFGNSNNFISTPIENFGTGNSGVNNIPIQSSISFGSSSGSTGFGSSISAPDSYGSPLGEPISNFDNNQIITSSNFNNNNNNQLISNNQVSNNNFDSYQSGNGNSNGNNFASSSASNNNLNNDVQNFGVDSGLNAGSSGQLNNNPFLNQNSLSEQLVLQESRQQSNLGQCKTDRALKNLLSDIFMGNEMIPDVLDKPPKYPLDLTYKTIRTFPGMKVTADVTKFKPMLHWPAEPDALYTVVLSNLDINNRKNRTLAEFWHWFVANIPGDSLDEGETVFDLLFPLVLPDGNGDHRFGYFVFKQPEALDYADEGGPTDACSPNMSNGRGPFKSTKNFAKKYNLELTAATFLIVAHSDASMDIACEWQKCIGDTINLVSPLRCGNDNK